MVTPGGFIVQSLKQLCKKCVLVDVILLLGCQAFVKRDHIADPIEDHLRPLASRIPVSRVRPVGKTTFTACHTQIEMAFPLLPWYLPSYTEVGWIATQN